jgi:DNA-binding GntR family transcriptional regulator
VWRAPHAIIYDKYLRYQMIAAVFRGELAASEHKRLLDSALARNWEVAQQILVTHVRDCVETMLAGGLIR